MPSPIRLASFQGLSVGLGAAIALAFAACTFNPGPPGSSLTSTGGAPGAAGSSGAGGTTGAGGSVYISGTAGTTHPTTGAAGTTVVGGGPGIVVPIPAGYTNVDVGAFKLGAQIPANGGTTMIDSPQTGCYQVTGV